MVNRDLAAAPGGRRRGNGCYGRVSTPPYRFLWHEIEVKQSRHKNRELGVY